MPPLPDPYGNPVGQTSGGTKQVAVVKSDTNNLDGTPAGLSIIARGILVNETGPVNVSFIAFGDTTAQTWIGLTAGYLIPMWVTRVMSTNTTATTMLALY